MRMRQVIAVLVALLGLGSLSAKAQTDSTVLKIIEENHEIIEQKYKAFKTFPHQIRLGVGDWFFDTVAFPDTPHRPYSMAPGDMTFMEQQDHRFIPHLFIEYDWTPSKRWGFGVMLDFFGFRWNNVTYKTGSDTPIETSPEHCENWAVMGHVRYNWYTKNEKWKVYSALHAGLDVNTGSETDMYGKTTEIGFAFSPTLLGVQYGYGHFFAAAEIGSHFALKDALNLYSALSKIVTISAGVRF